MRSIALDVGTKNIGIAITDKDKKFITILPKADVSTCVDRSNNLCVRFDSKCAFDLLKEKLSMYWAEIDQVIIGNSEDAEYDSNKLIASCQKQLKRNFTEQTMWEVCYEYEIYTSVESFKILKNLHFSSKKIKQNIDSCSAAIILSNFFFNKGIELVIGF